MSNVQPLRLKRKPKRVDRTNAERQRRYQERKRLALQGLTDTATAQEITPEITAVSAPPVGVSEHQHRTTPLAVTAVTEALSALCDAIEYVTPEQLLEALEGEDLKGVLADAEVVGEWVIRLFAGAKE